MDGSGNKFKTSTAITGVAADLRPYNYYCYKSRMEIPLSERFFEPATTLKYTRVVSTKGLRTAEVVRLFVVLLSYPVDCWIRPCYYRVAYDGPDMPTAVRLGNKNETVIAES